jgi:enoyl-CoA hydratase/carnithine racemase
LAALTIDAQQLWAGEAPYCGALAFVDLARTSAWPDRLALPACPVIGLGDVAHPLAGKLDTVIEAPIGVEAVARQVLAQPQAAAVVGQLLRLLPSLPAEEGLTAESLAYGLLQGSAAHREWIAGQVRQPIESAPREVRIDRTGDHLTVTLDDPASGNAIDRAMRDALYAAFGLAALDPEIARVSLRGAGRTFSLGAELAEFGTTTDPATAHAIRRQTLPARMIAPVADRLDVHVQGGCVGAGLEIAAWADRFTATPDAWFQLPELAMGVLPGAGGCVSLTRRIGRQRTALLILSGKRISARIALGWGLVDAILDEPA